MTETQPDLYIPGEDVPLETYEYCGRTIEVWGETSYRVDGEEFYYRTNAEAWADGTYGEPGESESYRREHALRMRDVM